MWNLMKKPQILYWAQHKNNDGFIPVVNNYLDRVIYAYGEQNQFTLYTLFRPFNWIGAKQDDILNR